jgi:hypothetical protein
MSPHYEGKPNHLTHALTTLATHGPDWTYTTSPDGTHAQPDPDPRPTPTLPFPLTT